MREIRHAEEFKEVVEKLNLDNAEEITIIIRRKPDKDSDMAESRAKADKVFNSLIEKMEEIEKSVEEQEETPEQCEYCEHDCEVDDGDDEEEMTCMDYIAVLDDKVNDVMGEIADIKEKVDSLMTNIPASFDLLETRIGVAPSIKKKTGKEIMDAIKTLESELSSHRWGSSEVLAELKLRVSDNEEMLKGLVKDTADIKRIGLANATSLNRLNNQLKMVLNTRYGLSENLCTNTEESSGDKPTQEMLKAIYGRQDDIEQKVGELTAAVRECIDMLKDSQVTTELVSEPGEPEQKKPSKKSTTAKKPTAKK